MLRRTTRLAAAACLSLFGLGLAGLAFEQWSQRAAARLVPPGRLVPVDGIVSHLHCTGTGAPTVVFESGLDTAGALAWALVQPQVATLTRACSYDRAGYMWSGVRAGPRDGLTIARELRALLAQAPEAGPFVLVGHSLGGALVRIFAATAAPHDVQGVVFVDASHPALATLDPAALQTPPALLFTVLGTLGVLRLADPGAPDLPDGPRRAVEAFGPQGAPTYLAEGRAATATLGQAAAAGALGDRPLVVFTALDHPPERQQRWRALQDDLAGLSTNADHRFVHGDHDLHQHQPTSVVAAVHDLVVAVRQGTRVRHQPPADDPDHR